MLLIGIVIVVILAATAFVLWPRKWKYSHNVDFVFGVVKPQGGSGDGNVSYIGNYPTQGECELECEKRADCRAYTWYTPENGSMPRACYGMKNIGKRVEGAHVESAELTHVENFAMPAGAILAMDRLRSQGQTFSNTLQRRLGMTGAGEGYSTNARNGSFDEHYSTNANRNSFDEHYSSTNQAAGTMWDGYHNTVIIPQ